MKILGYNINRNISEPKNITKKRPNRVDIEDKITKTTNLQIRQDIQAWNMAVDQARSEKLPSRTKLMEVYLDISIDGHLTGIVTSLKRKIKSKQFQLVNSEGEVNEDLTKNFQKKWFDDFLTHAVDSFFYGYSLIGLGNIVDDYFDSVQLIPREYVVPELHRVKKNKYVFPSEGNSIDYKQPPYLNWYILQGSEDKNLGLYHNITPHAIGKKNLMIQAWDNAELYGIPIRIIKTDTSDEERRMWAEKALADMGSNASGVIDSEDELELKDRSMSDAYKTFIEPYKLSNEEISKSIAGQTMMFDDGSSKSQGEVHERLFDIICGSFADEIGYMVNRELIPRMNRLGMPYNKMIYEWVERENISIEQKVAIITSLAHEGLVFEDGYIEEYTGIKAEQKINLGLDDNTDDKDMVSDKHKEIINLYNNGKDNISDI